MEVEVVITRTPVEMASSEIDTRRYEAFILSGVHNFQRTKNSRILLF
jgi:hypothetical protein